jgi:hypothetical protein
MVGRLSGSRVTMSDTLCMASYVYLPLVVFPLFKLWITFTFMYENLVCNLLCNVQLVLWSHLRVGFAHISDPVVGDLPVMTWQRRQNTSLSLLNGHVDRLRRNTELFWALLSQMATTIRAHIYVWEVSFAKFLFLTRWFAKLLGPFFLILPKLDRCQIDLPNCWSWF